MKKTKKYASYQEKIKELFKDQKISLNITNTMRFRQGNEMFTLKSDVDVEECTDYWTIEHYKTKNIENIDSEDRWKHAECTVRIAITDQAEDDQEISDKLNTLMTSMYDSFMRNPTKTVSHHTVKYNTTSSLSVEKYLKKFEANCLLHEVIQIPPPEISNFYWKNNYGNKYKAFIPTPGRNVYYSLKEYAGEMELKEINEGGWKFAEKCVLLAVSNKCPKDQPFIDHMEFLIANFAAWAEQNNDHWENVGFDVQYEYYRHTNRHYIITEYLVDDLKDVPMQLRGKCGRFRGAMTITPEHDNAKVIYAMNIAFELAAKRFANDKDLGVYAYGCK